jgi:hypothetical protein
MLLERDNDKLLLKGKGEAKLYQHQNNVITIQEGDVSYLMR